MKKLFIYYSLSGNGDIVGNELKKKGYDIYKLILKRNMPKLFIMQILVGGFQALIKYKAKLVNLNIDINKYDKIVIGSPIWNDRLSSPINELLDKINLVNKNVTFILYSGSGKADNAIKRINNEYPNSSIIILKEPKKNKDYKDKFNL